jgi:hypothetical protein
VEQKNVKSEVNPKKKIGERRKFRAPPRLRSIDVAQWAKAIG